MAQPINELSEYAKFHYKFLGQSPKDRLTGRVYKKSIFFELFPNSVQQFMNNGKAENFIMTDSKGWENGGLITKTEL